MQYQDLLQFCMTGTQTRTIEACIEAGSQNKAAKLLGISPRALKTTIARIKRNAAARGWAPEHDMTKIVPQGFHVKGTSTLYDDEGNLKIQWVKTAAEKDDAMRRIMEAWHEAFAEFRGCSLPTKPPKHSDSDMLTVYPMGDPHIGMYAWAEEAGEDFDCDIAERNLVGAVQSLVRRSPPSETAIILNLGDFFHSDSLENKSLNSGHSYDVDSRWPRVLRIGAMAMIACVNAALEKHKKVIVKNIIGNHDTHTSQALALALSLYFDNNARVHVDTSPARFWFYQFGKVLIGSTHGDTVKPEMLGGVMAAQQPELWGKTKYRYWYTGHIHKTTVMELAGCLWESFRTLAAKDAWSASKGYTSGRSMVSIHLDRTHGEQERHTMVLPMLEVKK